MRRRNKMIVIGLTGGSGSGKSTVSNIARQQGFYVIDADQLARDVVAKGQKALSEIVSAFGQEILTENGELNRKKLGSIVFSDKEKLTLLNQITHKYIVQGIKERIETQRKQKQYKGVIIDVAILIESDLYYMCDIVWVVIANRNSRIERIMKRDLLTYEEAVKRINSQMPDEVMEKYADVIIENTGEIKKLEAYVKNLLK